MFIDEHSAAGVLSDADRKVLTDYIMVAYQSSQIDPDKPPAVNPPALVEQGRQLFYTKYACQSCHMANTKTDKGYVGPVLAQVGLRLKPARIYAWLKDPQALWPGTSVSSSRNGLRTKLGKTRHASRQRRITSLRGHADAVSSVSPQTQFGLSETSYASNKTTRRKMLQRH